MTTPTPTRRRFRPRWRWLWAVLLVAMLGFGAGLPWLVRRILVEQASQALHTRVDVGDVDIFLPSGTVVLKRVAVWPPTPADTGATAAPTPVPPTAGASDAPSPPEPPETAADAAQNQPILAWHSLLVDVDWLPLLKRKIKVAAVTLDGPLINLDRLASGDLNVQALINNAIRTPEGATPSPTPEPTPSPDPASAWKYGVDKLSITHGRFDFRDFFIGDPEPVHVRIPDIVAEQLAMTPDVYGDPSAAKLHFLIDDGSIDIRARASLPPNGVQVHVGVEARRLPLRRSRLYVPVVGWSDLEGELDADVEYTLDTGTRHDVRSAVTLRDVVIRVPDVPDAALSSKRLFVNVDPLDLQNRSATVASLELDGGWLGIWTTGKEPLLPVLSRRAAGKATPPTSEPTPVAGEPAAPWQWRLASARVQDTTVRLVGPEGPVDIGVDLTAKDISSAPQPGTVALGLKTATGTLGVDAHVRPIPPAFSGTVKTGTLSLPPLIVASNAVKPNPLQSGTLDTDLAIEAGLATDGSDAAGARDVRVRGTLSLADARVVVGADAPTEISAASIGFDFTELALPSVLTVANPGGTPGGDAGNITLEGAINIAQPNISLAGGTGPRVAADQLGVTIGGLTLAGMLAGPAGVKPDTRPDFGNVGLQGSIAVANPSVGLPGASPVDVTAGELAVAIGDLALPGILGGATAAARPDVGDVRFNGGLSVTDGKVNLNDGNGLQVGVKSMGLADAALTLTALLAPPEAPPRPHGGDVGFRGTLSLADASVDTGAAQHMQVGARSIGLKVGDLSLDGLLAKPAPGGAGPSGDVRVRADLNITEPRVGLANSKDLQVLARTIAIGLSEADIPGVLSPGSKKPAHGPRVALREVRLESPNIRVTRTQHGLVLGPQPEGTPEPTPAETPAPETPNEASPTPSPSETPAAASGPALELALNSLRLTQGRVVLVDRTVKPEFNGGLSQIDVDVRDFRLPGPNIGQMRISADTPGDGTILLTGNFTPEHGDVRFESSDVALTPYNPYAVAFSPYRITDGSLFVSSEVKKEGETYHTNTKITFEEFDLGGNEGESLFAKQFGIPLTTALALLTDLDGKMKFDIPAQIDAKGTSVALGPIITDVVRKALVNALAAPLKLVGSLVGGNDKFTPPAPIAFLPGRAELAPTGTEATDHLGTLLEKRPALGVALSSDATTDDVRWLHEQALRTKWAEGGILTRALAQVGSRGRVEDFLEARAEDKPAKLEPDDAAQLDQWLAEIPAPTPEKLRALAADRLALTAAKLRDNHALDSTRIRVDEPGDHIGDGTPVVDLSLKRASRLFAAPAPEPQPEPEPQP